MDTEDTKPCCKTQVEVAIRRDWKAGAPRRSHSKCDGRSLALMVMVALVLYCASAQADSTSAQPFPAAAWDESQADTTSARPLPAAAWDQSFASPQPRSINKRLVPDSRGIISVSQADAAAGLLLSLELERGKSVVLKPNYSVRRVAIGDPEVIDVVVNSKQEIEIVAKEVGQTNLLLWDSNGRIQAAIDVQVGVFRTEIVRELQRVLGNTDITVDMAGASIVLRGAVASLVERERAQAVAEAFFAGQSDGEIINLLDVGGNHQVMIEVTFAEMSRSIRKEFGSQFSAALIEGTDFVKFTNAITNLADEAAILMGKWSSGSWAYEFMIEALETEGLIKILAEPNLIARSGHRASFLAGGEVPLIITNRNESSITYKSFGVAVEFLPTVLSSNRIHLIVEPEVSAIDPEIGVQIPGGSFVPGFQTRRASTAIELADGQTFAIAGLLRSDVNSVVQRYPYLGRIPIIGAAFRSQEFENKETELVLIVTVHLVKPLAGGTPPLPTDHYIAPSSYEFYLLGRLEAVWKDEVDEPPLASRAVIESGFETGGMIGEVGYRISATQLTEGDQ